VNVEIKRRKELVGSAKITWGAPGCTSRLPWGTWGVGKLRNPGRKTFGGRKAVKS